MTEPLVSVILPTYNRANYLEESIDSVLAQEFEPFELVVVDDGSQDNTSEILARYDDARLVAIRQENGGYAAARTTGIEAARAALIAFHDSDDKMLPDRLAAQVAFMREHPEVGALTGNMNPEGDDASNGLLAERGVEFGDAEWVIFENAFERLALKNFMLDPASIVRREVFIEAGGYDTSIRTCADWDLWLRVARRHTLACLRLPCTWFRRHEGNITDSPRARSERVQVLSRSLREGIETGTIGPAMLERIRQRLYTAIGDYIFQNLCEEFEPDWRESSRCAAECLGSFRRAIVKSVVGVPGATWLAPRVVRLKELLRGTRK